MSQSDRFRQMFLVVVASLVGIAGLMVWSVSSASGQHQDKVSSQVTQALQDGKAHAPLTQKDISATQAQAVLLAAVAKAAEMDLMMDIAVVDAGGNLKTFLRMDGAWLGSIDIAIKKAKTARYFDMPTGEVGKLSQPGGPLYQIEASNDGLITFPGGIPLKLKDGTIIGAVGVSGSTVENDHTVAQAGAAAIQ